jgi:hypothetical protein
VKAELLLDSDGRTEVLHFAGTSLRGAIYRSGQSGWWYRLVPCDQAPADWHESLQRHSFTMADDQLIAPVRHWRQSLEGVAHLVVLYRHNIPGRTMAECLQDSTPDSRVRCAAGVLRALPNWWQHLHRPLVPLPADIVLGVDNRLRLLWMPPGPLPGYDTILADPHRVLYLSPELVRSASNLPWDESTWEAIDRYAVGVGVLQCYHRLPDVDRFETAMFRTANGTLLNQLQPRTDFPPWVERFATHHNTITVVQRLTAPTLDTRRSVHLGQLADRLEHHLQLFDARRAVEQLRDLAKPAEAVDLLQEVFPLIESLSISVEMHYDLLRLAGELCEKYLRRPLDALDFYDRAIDLLPAAPQACRDQMRMIANARHHPALALLLQAAPDVAGEIDAKLWRNYTKLYQGRAHHAANPDEHLDDHLIARYLLWREQFAQARDFIFPRLTDANGKYLWWDFELNLAYVAAFIGLETGEGSNASRAVEQLRQVRNGLRFARQNHTLDASTAAAHGQEVSELERQLFAMGYHLSDPADHKG